mgnify:CR=1 FL=1
MDKINKYDQSLNPKQRKKTLTTNITTKCVSSNNNGDGWAQGGQGRKGK